MSKQTKIEEIRTIIRDNRKSGKYKFLFFIDGNYYAAGKVIKKILPEEVPAILESDPEIWNITIDKRIFSALTGLWEGMVPREIIPPELQGCRIQSVTINSRNTESEAVYNLLELLTKNSYEAWKRICYFIPE